MKEQLKQKMYSLLPILWIIIGVSLFLPWGDVENSSFRQALMGVGFLMIVVFIIACMFLAPLENQPLDSSML